MVPIYSESRDPYGDLEHPTPPANISTTTHLAHSAPDTLSSLCVGLWKHQALSHLRPCAVPLPEMFFPHIHFSGRPRVPSLKRQAFLFPDLCFSIALLLIWHTTYLIYLFFVYVLPAKMEVPHGSSFVYFINWCVPSASSMCSVHICLLNKLNKQKKGNWAELLSLVHFCLEESLRTEPLLIAYRRQVHCGTGAGE